jgi:hypothetical protein
VVLVPGWTVNVAESDLPLYVAVIVTEVAVATDAALSVKVAWVEPAGTVTEAGTDTAGFELAREITIPPAPAGTFSATVPAVEDAPLASVDGPKMAVRLGGFTTRFAVLETPA